MKEIRIRIPTPMDLVPEEVQKHGLRFVKELLLAIRSVVDEHVKAVEELEARVGKEGKG